MPLVQRSRPHSSTAARHTLAGVATVLAACARAAVPSSDTTGPRAAAGDSATPAAQSAQSAQPVGRRDVWVCGDGFRFGVETRGDSVVLALPTSVATLPQVRAASGTRYAAGGLVFWSKGATAELGPDSDPAPGATPSARPAVASRTDCQRTATSSPWQEAELLGVAFRALGQEPFWLLDVLPGTALRLSEPDRGTRVAAPLRPAEPEPASGGTPAGLRYTARLDGVGGAELSAVVRETACQDVMSGEPFPYTVTVRADGRELRGCGRPIARSATEPTGTYWRLVAFDGAPLPPSASADASRDPWLRLLPPDLAGETRAIGHTGCNGFNGRYTRRGDSLRFSPIASTRMACMDPVRGDVEQPFVTALGATDRMTVRGDTLLLLGGGRTVARLVSVPLR